MENINDANRPPAQVAAATVARRTLLTGGAVAAASWAASAALPSVPAAATPGTAADAVAELERRHGRRIGLYAKNLRTGKVLSHRAEERFGLCSTSKTLAVAALLDGRLVTPDRRVLARAAHYPPSLVEGAGYAPRLTTWQEEGYVPSVAEICEVTLADSDNAGMNWVLQLIGGPTAVTAFARRIGDKKSTLTRWEPDLNDWEPDNIADTTTPTSLGVAYARLLAGEALPRPARDRLVHWMLGNRTGDATLRAGLPGGWRIAEKTGSGAYGARNDVGVAWTPKGTPVLISCLTRAEESDAPTADVPLADVASLCAQRLGQE